MLRVIIILIILIVFPSQRKHSPGHAVAPPLRRSQSSHKLVVAARSHMGGSEEQTELERISPTAHRRGRDPCPNGVIKSRAAHGSFTRTGHDAGYVATQRVVTAEVTLPVISDAVGMKSWSLFAIGSSSLGPLIARSSLRNEQT